MFQSISWQDFLTTITLAVGGYYVITMLLLYSNEIKTIFKQKQPKQSAPEESDDQSDSNESISLMGKIKYNTEVNVPHENVVESEDIKAQPLREAEEPIRQSATTLPEAMLLATIADLLQEVKAVITSLPNSNKEEMVLFFQHLLSRYTQLAQTTYQEAINLFIYNSLKANYTFDLDLNEIKSWWTTAESTSNDNQ